MVFHHLFNTKSSISISSLVDVIGRGANEFSFRIFQKNMEKNQAHGKGAKKFPLIFNYNFSSVCSALVISSVGGTIF